ncbi:RRS1-domain-containing protein [Trametes sanguinea]|nr:RRS1-domain-containing protein [Trametes sanguinea]
MTHRNLRRKSVTVEKEIPLEVDTGFLTVTDLNPVDAESYEANLEEYLMSTARDGVQTLLASLFSLPTTSSPDGPLAQLPAPTTQLPRAKPLPKPKPMTKWEKFAKAKGIQKKRRDKKIWDEEKQEWVDRWGWKGANKAKETQWLSEVPANADVDYDPAKVARDARKARVAKNEKQRQQNLARAAQEMGPSAAPAPVDVRKKQIDRTLAVTRTSTASMGKFDRKLEGEKKLKGMKRKVRFDALSACRSLSLSPLTLQFEPTEMSAESEKSHNLAILSKLDKEPAAKKSKKSAEGSDVLNVRKAIRATSKGKGSAALASGGKGGKGKKGKR